MTRLLRAMRIWLLRRQLARVQRERRRYWELLDACPEVKFHVDHVVWRGKCDYEARRLVNAIFELEKQQ